MTDDERQALLDTLCLKIMTLSIAAKKDLEEAQRILSEAAALKPAPTKRT